MCDSGVLFWGIFFSVGCHHYAEIAEIAFLMPPQ